MRIAVWLVVLAGCDDLFNLEPVERFDAAVDAFDRDLDCPADYDLTLFAGARYRITKDSLAAWDDHIDCADDRPGYTHLAVAQTQVELTIVHDAVIAKGLGRIWLGGVQPASVDMPGDGWLWVTGESIDRSQWGNTEPNDANGNELDHLEQFVAIDGGLADKLIDYSGANGIRGLCECDGRPISDDAQMAIDQAKPP
jgi:hypothetical protein